MPEIIIPEPDKPYHLTLRDQGPNLDNWVPLTTRYGISKIPEDHMGLRHGTGHRLLDNQKCEANLKKRCVCPGMMVSRNGCCEAATEEDRLCDSCRMFCYGILPDGETYISLVKGLGEYDWNSGNS